jgi:predicted ArsR family transcriptional regulator
MARGDTSGMTGDDPLSQPTRARAFEYLSQLRRPAQIEEIAEHLSLHPTGVRVHLARLEEAGLVQRRPIRGGRGRPRFEWTVAPDAMPRGQRPDAHGQLAAWLAGAVAAGAVTHEGLEEHGYEIGRGLAPAPRRAPAAEALGDVLSAMGFQPECHTDGAVTTYELRNCPYRDAVHSGGRHICALHAGISRGLLQRLAPDARLSDFVARDPDKAGCLIEVEGLTERS